MSPQNYGFAPNYYPQVPTPTYPTYFPQQPTYTPPQPAIPNVQQATQSGPAFNVPNPYAGCGYGCYCNQSVA